MSKQSQAPNEEELARLAQALSRYEVDEIEPLSEAEVAAIEADYETVDFSAEREARQRAIMEALRREWLTEAPQLDGILAQARRRGFSPQALAQQLRIGVDVLFRIDLHLVSDLPLRFVRHLAQALEVERRTLQSYLASPAGSMNQMAASSKGKPAAGRPQTWSEALEASDMALEDRAYWLEEDTDRPAN
jgi:hypothetical protein